MPTVVSVNKSPEHSFSKQPVDKIVLVKGIGVEGDAHGGVTVKHRSRVKADPSKPNLRQVHLIHIELIEELQSKGFNVEASSMGENVTTKGIDLLSLPEGALLHIGPEAIVKITGLRNPCAQLDDFQPGLMTAVLDRDSEGNLVRKPGVMSVVIKGGPVSPGDEIDIELPKAPYKQLRPV